MLQSPLNFFYVEVGKVYDFDFLGEKGESLARIRRKSLWPLVVEMRSLI